MRLTILPLIFLTASCIADVGGDECTGQRCKAGTGSGSGSATAGCDDPEELSTNLTIRSSADFDALPRGCWSLNANLRLEGPGITTLARLGDLIEVNDLELVDTGLTSLTTKKTIKVYGSLLVSGNRELASLDNLAVKRWDGLTQGGVPFSVGYTIRNNAALTGIGGLKYISQVDNDLRITDNAKLAAVELAELTTVTGGVHVTGTAATAIRLPALATVARLEIAGNPQLTQLSGLAATAIAGDLTLRANPALATIGSMSSLSSIGGALIVDDNDALIDLGALTGVMQRISGAVTITNNARLSSLGQLGHLASGIGSTVAITGNPQLSTCRAVEIDHCVSHGGAVTIQNNQQAGSCACWCGI